MKFWVVALCFALALSQVVAHEGHDHHDHDHEHSEDSSVLILNQETFQDEIKKHDMVLVEFFAPWCGHCKALAPQFEIAARELKDVVALASVDCTTERSICQDHGVKGFPTLKIFSKDGSVADYQGGRKAEDIVKYMKKQRSPAYTIIKSEDIEGLRAQESILVVGSFASLESAEALVFIESANAMRNDYSFSIVNEEGASRVTLYKEDGSATFEGVVNADNLKTFINSEAFPVLGDIGPENYQKYVERGYPLVWVFVDLKSDATQAVLDAATEVAKEFKGRLSFVKLDGVRWNEHGKNFGLKSTTPGIVIEDRENDKNYVFPEEQEFSAANIRAHAQGFVDGTLSHTVKSEEIPAVNNGPVKVVVGKTFESIVLDPSKDVFVEFYAPWCGHCKTLAPKWDKLGEMMFSESDLVIAKMDSTANDVPGVEIQGFPTIMFFPANDKANPVKYQGERTEEAMAKWLKEHQTKKSTKTEAAGHDEL